ncbi:MAG: hypothetical protein WD068_03345 [Candidatus Babeliales bacterium]
MKLLRNILVRKLIMVTLLSLKVGSSQAEKIFFDLGGVLFDASKVEALRTIGLGASVAYYTQLKKPQSGKKYLFECLNQLKKRYSDSSACYGDLILPQYIEDWLSGTYATNAELLREVHEGVGNLAITDADKEFVRGIARYMFNPYIFAQSTQIIPQGLEMVRACYAQRNLDGTRAHRLYVISNWDAESYALLAQRSDLQEFWGMFDGVILSGQEKVIKPARTIFDIARQRAGIETGGIFIDDQPENITAAQEFGFDGILCDSHERVWEQLAVRGVVAPRTFIEKNHTRMKSAISLALAAGAVYYAGPALAQTTFGKLIIQSSLWQTISSLMGS